MVLADGFSCRTQLDDLAGVRALHLAELLAACAPRGRPPTSWLRRPARLEPSGAKPEVCSLTARAVCSF